jgi:8-oxo-dGTP diphosphatase
MKKFPSGQYGRQRLQFFPAPFRAPLRAFAGLVFPWVGEKIVVCDIMDRGWSIPSGRVEPNETSLEAVKREAVEEAGAVLCNVQYIGCYHITERRETRWADCYVAQVAEFVEIGMQEESRGRRVVSLEELPEIYHLWNPLTQMVFDHSREVLERMLKRKQMEASELPQILFPPDLSP